MKRPISRRRFLRSTSAGLALPLLVPASVLGRTPSALAPSERITMGCIGVGGRGSANLGVFHGKKESQIVAVSDVDASHLAGGLQRAGLNANAGYADFRELLEQSDLDAVMVGTPDHWHALVSIAALKAGKDVYCEKPLAASIAEGQALVRAVDKYKRILQCGTQRRSMAGCRFACELVRNGRIGKVQRVEVGVPGRFAIRGGYSGTEATQPIPQGFDYARWLGPCPEAPYTAARCHFNFRWVMEYAPGYITDWGAHYLDIAQWGLGTDSSGPVTVKAHDVRYREGGIYNAPEGFRIVFTYGDGAQAILLSTTDKSRWGMKFFGDKGTVYVESENVVTEPENLKSSKIAEGEIRLYDAKNDHHGNFLDCVRSRKEPSAPVRIAHRSASTCQLGAIACALDRELTWNPAKEQFVGDDEANQRLARPMREPWTV